jgi:ribosome biogenesis GTPase
VRQHLAPGRTAALLGSSGVGKSTIINRLVGTDVRRTQEVRPADSRGRHTTTHRELVALPGGALLVDTPGMRELQLWGDESSLASAFPEIDALAAECRFRDCGHQSEPGCAVLAAEASGRLEAGRLASWRKLQRELRWLAAKQDDRLKAQQVARWKAIHKSMRSHPKLRARGERRG